MGFYTVVYFVQFYTDSAKFCSAPGLLNPAPLPWLGGDVSRLRAPACSPGLQVACAPLSGPHGHTDCLIPSGPSSNQDTAGLWIILSNVPSSSIEENIAMERGIQRALVASRIGHRTKGRGHSKDGIERQREQTDGVPCVRRRVS